jgi:protein TonB
MPLRTSDKTVEKSFLYLLAFSLLLHALLFAIIMSIPLQTKVAHHEPIMVDLQDLPLPKGPVSSAEKERRPAAKSERHPAAASKQPVAPEPPTRGISGPPRIAPPARPSPSVTDSGQPPREQSAMPQPGKEGGRSAGLPRGESLLRPQVGAEPTDLVKLFPRAERLSKLEEGYRRKYTQEVEDGKATFLNADDIQFGSFMRRFETAVYGVWRYPPEAISLGVQGVTPVRITFKRNGEIETAELLESSGSPILDKEVLRTLHSLGPIGSLPKSYDKDKFSLIAFFVYRLVGGSVRGVLR